MSYQDNVQHTFEKTVMNVPLFTTQKAFKNMFLPPSEVYYNTAINP